MSRSLQQSVASTPAVDDFALMDGIRAKDTSAFGTLYDRYSDSVFALCLRALQDPRDAEDLLVEIFSEIWERGDRFDATRGSPIGHIMGLARSRVIDRLRSRRSASRIGADRGTDLAAAADHRESTAGPLDAAIFSEQRRRVVAAMDSLPSEQRQALELAFFEALTHSEVAERLGQPLGTVKSRIRQALLSLRATLGRSD